MIKVKATRMGFYGNARKREGDTFSVPTKKDIASWMEEVVEKRPAPEAGSTSNDGNSGNGGDGTGSDGTGAGTGGDGGGVNPTVEALQADLDAKVAKSNELVAAATEARGALKPNSKAGAVTAVEILEAEAQAAYEAAEAAQVALDEVLL
jgi:hypothetical protein